MRSARKKEAAMTLTLKRTFAIAAAIAPLLIGPAATAAGAPSAVTIQFQRGTTCWKYSGSATTFRGSFKAGQVLDVTSTGEFDFGNATGSWAETKSRMVYVADGTTGKLLPANQNGDYSIPRTGAYEISFGPMSVVGSPGAMFVCTL
jgi:hypothetical protein